MGASRNPFSSMRSRAAHVEYRDTLLVINNPSVGPYSRTVPKALWKSWGGDGFS
jgi:hypothetical protein